MYIHNDTLTIDFINNVECTISPVLITFLIRQIFFVLSASYNCSNFYNEKHRQNKIVTLHLNILASVRITMIVNRSKVVRWSYKLNPRSYTSRTFSICLYGQVCITYRRDTKCLAKIEFSRYVWRWSVRCCLLGLIYSRSWSGP